MSDLTTLTAPFTAAQARADLDIDLPASRHEYMRSLDDPFETPSPGRIAADTLHGWREDECLL
jgi:hypothetical protein